MNKTSLLLLLVLCLLLPSVPALAVSNPADMPVTATIASLRNIPAAAAPINPNIQVQDYYGTGTTCPSLYTWKSADTRSDDGGGIINPTGNTGAGRWNLQLQTGSPAHSCQWGVKIDTPVASGSFTYTDNATQLQRMIDWSYNYGPNKVYLDTVKGFCAGFLTTLIPHEGEVFDGNGQQQIAGFNPSNSCYGFYGTSGPAFFIQTPYPGFGNTPYESPKWYNVAIYTDPDNNFAGSTGCIKINSAAGGWTNDATTQQPVMHPIFDHVTCTMGFGVSSQTGIYCAKCFDGGAWHLDSEFGGTAVVWDGSDDMELGGSFRISGTYSYMVKMLGEGGSAQFGNMDRIIGGQFLSFSSSAQTVDAFVLDTTQTSEVRSVFVEGDAPVGGALTSQFNIGGGINHQYENNYISANADSGSGTAPWIQFSGCPLNMTAINNAVAAKVGAPIYASNFGCPYWYNNVQQRQFVHYGNTQAGDVLWPFNSTPPPVLLPTGAVAAYSPSLPGLTYSGLGTTETPSSGEFVLGPTGSTNFLLFQNNFAGSNVIKGTLDAQIVAYQNNNATGQITCQITDNGSVVGSPIAQAITNTPYEYPLSFAQAVTTNGGIECWNSGTAGTGALGVRMSQVLLMKH